MVEQFRLNIHTTADNIREGIACDQNRCMQRVAIIKAVDHKFPNRGHVHAFHVKVNGAVVTLNHDGHHWAAILPKTPRSMLIKFDNPRTRHLVVPHKYWLVFTKGRKIEKMPRERQEQINEARRQRIAEGRPDKAYNTRKTLRQRITGMA